ncbi:MAG: metallophosphoesterase family protein [Candidatus Nanoarchaeia archaeon]
MKLGTVSCLHGNLRNAKKFARIFKKICVDAIVLLGDVPSDKNQKKSLIKILKIFSKTKKKVFVLPGSHEQYEAYYAALKKFGKNENIVDCTKTLSAKIGNRKLVFIAGADVSAPGAGFRLLENKRQMRLFKTHVRLLKEHFWGKVKPILFNKLAKLIDKETILVSHIPPKFNTPEAIDVAVFGEPKKSFILLEKHKKLNKTTKGTLMQLRHVVFTLDESKKMLKAGYPIKIVKKNVGNPWLKKIIKKKKISKFICGHIHEAGGRANNLKGEPVKPGKWSNELFYNCSGMAGIVEFKNNFARYRNVRV